MKKTICVFAILFTFFSINGQKLIKSDIEWSKLPVHNPTDNIIYFEQSNGSTYFITNLSSG